MGTLLRLLLSLDPLFETMASWETCRVKQDLDMPGALHHIMVRGINKGLIFVDEQDKSNFLQRPHDRVTDGNCAVYAWVLMDNQAHILFKSGREGISMVMRTLLTWYAQYSNKRHGRTGHLFENRYKSILCDEEASLVLVRYLHLNLFSASQCSSQPERTGFVSVGWP